MTVRQWLLKNADKFEGREALIKAAMSECKCERGQVTRIIKSLGIMMEREDDLELTPHWKYDNMYERFAEWMGMGARDATPAKAPQSKVIHGVIACPHAPFHDEAAIKEADGWFKANGVTEIHIAGDLADLHSFSTFTKFTEVPIQREAVEARKIVDYFSREYERVRILEGNHETREKKYLARTLPPDILAWVLQASFLERVVGDMENVELVRMDVENTEDYELGWIEPVGSDCVIGHAEKTTSMIDSLRGVEKLRQWLNNGWDNILGLGKVKVLFNAHSHRAGVIPIGSDIVICELGCTCKLSSYALSPKKLYGKPQTQAATIFEQTDGVTDVNSIRQRYLGR